MARLANRFPDLRFSLSAASDLFIQDQATLAKHLPNVSVAGYWWHTLYPGSIRSSLESRLDMIPMNKIVGFFSDAYHAEWVYPKLKLVKQNRHGDLRAVAAATYERPGARMLAGEKTSRKRLSWLNPAELMVPGAVCLGV